MSTFELLPAIDLHDGRVVRLRQGDFDSATAYSDDPVAVARAFARAGAEWLHVVDLDAARAGVPVHGPQVAAIVAAFSPANLDADRPPDAQAMAVEVAGGLRTAAAVEAVLSMGAGRAVVGTSAIHDPAFAGRLVAAHGQDRIAVALDVRGGEAVGGAWATGAAGLPVDEILGTLADEGVETFEVTAIDRDGQLEGPDLGLLARLVGLKRGRIIASAGIASLDDLVAVQSLGCAGAIVGRAIYEGRLDLAAATSWVRAGRA